MNFRNGLALALLLHVLILVGCRQPRDTAPTPAVSQAFVPYENQEHGISLEHPEDWVVHRSMSGLTVASSQLVIDTTSLSEIGDGAFVNIIPGELAVFGMQTGQTFTGEQPEAVLQVYQELLEKEGQTYSVVEPPEVTTVDGRRVATTVVQSTVDGETLVTMLGTVLDGDYMALISAGSLASRFDAAQPTLEQIVNSITVSAPSNLES